MALYLGMKLADDAAGTVGVVTLSIEVLGALPRRVPIHEAESHWGHNQSNRKGFIRQFTVKMPPTTVVVSDFDFSDYEAVETALLTKEHKWLTATGTSGFVRAGIGGLFWALLLALGEYKVVLKGEIELSPSFEQGTDVASFTLEGAMPNV